MTTGQIFSARSGQLLVRVDAYPSLLLGALELHLTFDQGEERVIVSDPTVHTGVELGAALADDDRTGLDDLSSKALDAQSLGIRISTVLG